MTKEEDVKEINNTITELRKIVGLENIELIRNKDFEEKITNKNTKNIKNRVLSELKEIITDFLETQLKERNIDLENNPKKFDLLNLNSKIIKIKNEKNFNELVKDIKEITTDFDRLKNGFELVFTSVDSFFLYKNEYMKTIDFTIVKKKEEVEWEKNKWENTSLKLPWIENNEIMVTSVVIQEWTKWEDFYDLLKPKNNEINTLEIKFTGIDIDKCQLVQKESDKNFKLKLSIKIISDLHSQHKSTIIVDTKKDTMKKITNTRKR